MLFKFFFFAASFHPAANGGEKSEVFRVGIITNGSRISAFGRITDHVISKILKLKFKIEEAVFHKE